MEKEQENSVPPRMTSEANQWGQGNDFNSISLPLALATGLLLSLCCTSFSLSVFLPIAFSDLKQKGNKLECAEVFL